MDKKNNIDSLYKILGLFEDIFDKKSTITEEEYLAYLDRMYVRFLGFGNNEIYDSIHGLRKLGQKATHDMVRIVVFNMIDIINKGG